MAVTTTKTNKPINPRGNDQSPRGYNRAALYSGKALDFDGVNDYVDLDGFTLSGTTATICFNGLVTGANRYFFWVGGQNYGIINHDTLGFGVFDSVQWHYFGTTQRDKMSSYYIVNNGTTLSVYNNGVQIGSDVTATAINWSSPSKVLLASNNAQTEFLDGQIAGFKIFNTALTAAQVSDLYNNPEKIVPTGVEDTALKLWLPMMEGAGTTAYDGSGNGNHGTISGATWTHGIGSPVAQTAVIDWNKGSNIVVYSEKLDEWGKQNLTATQSTATAPDGSTNAYDLNDSDSGNYGILVPVASVAMAGDYVGSLFVKKTTGALSHYPGFDIGQPGAYVVIDTTNGTTATSGTGGIYSDITITSYNDDWWRVSAKATINSTSKPMRIWPAISQNGTSLSTAATGINTFWGAQVEQADAIGPYVYTGATAQTSDVLLPQGLTSGRDITGVNLFENVRKQGALNLDGNSWAEVHDNASLDVTTGLTLEAWIYFDASNDGVGIIGKWYSSTSERSYLLYQGNTTLCRFIVSDNGLNTNSISTASLSNGWNHIVGTDDGTNIKVYSNASLDNTSTSYGTLYVSDENLEIGRYNNGAARYDKQLAQPRIYNRALTAEEVERNYNAGKNIYK